MALLLIDREGWRREWLYCLSRFADLRAQQDRWLDSAESNPHYTFAEMMCSYCDDLMLGELDYRLALEAGCVTPGEVAIVSNFHALVVNYRSPAGDYDYDAIVRDPAWHQVGEEAQRVLATLSFGGD